MKLKNDNILKLILKSIPLLQIKYKFETINNISLTRMMLDLLSYENIFKAMRKNQTFGEHKKWINFISLLPDGNIISASEDNILKIWDLKTNQLIKTIKDDSFLMSLVVLPGNKIATCSWKGVIRIYETQSYKLIKEISVNDCYLDRVSLLSNGALACSGNSESDNIINIYDIDHYKLIKVIGKTGKLRTPLIDLGDNRLAFGFSSSWIKVWDYELNTKVCVLDTTKPITSLLFIEGNSLLLSGSNDGIIMIWSTEDYNCVKMVETQQGMLKSLLLLPSGYFASAGREIKLWNVKNFECINTLQGHSETVISLLFLKDNRIGSASSELEFFIWDY
jgi:WD40 repeat protein